MSLPEYGGLEREATVGATINRPGGNALGRVLAAGAAMIALGTVIYFGFLADDTPNEPEPVIQNEEFIPPQSSQLSPGFPEPRPPELPRFEVPVEPEPPAPPPEPAPAVVEPAPPLPEPVAPPPAVVAAEPPPPAEPDCSNPKDKDHPTCLALEEERKRLARLNSPLTVVDAAGTTAIPGVGAAAENGTRPTDPGAAGQAENDPYRAFLAERGNAAVDVATATPNPRTDAMILQGEMIRGVLETAINSDLPGLVRAVVSSPVYSFDGRRVLIPAGARLIGDYRAGAATGQVRVFIVWTRLIRPDGSSVMLGSFGTDSLGRSGMTGIVDTKFVERFGSAVLLSVIGGAAQFVGTLGNPKVSQGSSDIRIVDPVTGAITIIPGGSGSVDQRLASAQQIGANTASQVLTSLANEALKDGLQVQPTIHVRQGERITVFVGRDLDFSGLYPDPVREEFERLKALHREKGRGQPQAQRRAPSSPGLITK